MRWVYIPLVHNVKSFYPTYYLPSSSTIVMVVSILPVAITRDTELINLTVKYSSRSKMLLSTMGIRTSPIELSVDAVMYTRYFNSEHNNERSVPNCIIPLKLLTVFMWTPSNFCRILCVCPLNVYKFKAL